MCIVGEPEDDQEELLAAVNAARSAIGAYTVLLLLPGDCQASLWIDVYNFLFFFCSWCIFWSFLEENGTHANFHKLWKFIFLEKPGWFIFALDVMIECAFIVGWDGFWFVGVGGQINLVEELETSMSCMSDGEHDIIASSDYQRMQKMVRDFTL